MKKGFFIRWITNSLALIVVAYLIKGIEIKNITSALVASLILGIVNAVIRPIILFFTLPLTAISLGLSILVVNAAMLYLTSWFVDGFVIHNFLSALFGSILISIFSSFFSYLIGDQGKIEVMHFTHRTNHHDSNNTYNRKNDDNIIEVDYKVIDDDKIKN